MSVDTEYKDFSKSLFYLDSSKRGIRGR